MTQEIPTPGSDEAIDQGCTCPVLDNNHGKFPARSYDGANSWWITVGCPIHSLTPDSGPEELLTEEELDGAIDELVKDERQHSEICSFRGGTAPCKCPGVSDDKGTKEV